MLSFSRRASSILAIAFLASSSVLSADSPPATPAAPATAAAAPSTPPVAPTPSGPLPWVIGISRFAAENADARHSTLQETIPLLIISDLPSLPTRRTPDDVAEEIAALVSLRSRFSLGSDLATKLDARAGRFFDPILDVDAWNDGIFTADKQVSAAKDKLKVAVADAGVVSSTPADRPVQLWDGHEKGQLIDLPSKGLSQAAKAAKVDLLVTGTVSIDNGYATIQIRGFDSALDREVFSWKGYCAIDDPGPLAADIADRLERWAAGRDFSRLTVNLSPPSAELSVDGEQVSGGSLVIYSYITRKAHLYASAAGYSDRTADIDLALGDRKTVDMKLDPLATGTVDLSISPAGTAVNLDSVPLGNSPLSITLDGSRRIVTAQSKGMESQTVVLPPSGDSELNITLLPSDGLGPKGRILAAKDEFYQSFGWFVLSIPVTALTWGIYNGYTEAYNRSLLTQGISNPTLYGYSATAQDALIAAGVATGVTLTFVIIRLIKYLKSAH